MYSRQINIVNSKKFLERILTSVCLMEVDKMLQSTDDLQNMFYEVSFHDDVI